MSILVGGFIAAPVVAQRPDNDTRTTSPEKLTSRGNAKDVSAEAKVLAKAKNPRAAEEKLAELNASPPASARWHIETSQRLMRLADDLARDGARDAVPALVAQALQRLNDAEAAARGANDVKAQANARATAGHLHERYRGDTAAALASYQAALQLDPTDKGTREALERLQQSDAVLKARFEKGKRK